jgi:replicative DNA helicase
MKPQQDITLIQYQVLSTLVQQPHIYVQYAENLREAYFTETSFKQMVLAMHAVYDRLGTIDKYLLRDYLVKEVEEYDVTWLDALDYPMLELINLQEALATLKDQSVRRLFHELGLGLLQKSFDAEISLPELKNNLQDYLYQVNEVMPVSNVERFEEVLNRIKQTQIVTTQLTWFDDALQIYLGNLAIGDLVVIGARPGMGKTAFLHTQLLHLACNNKVAVGYINLIENERNLIAKLLKAMGINHTNQIKQDATLDAEYWPIYFSNQLPGNDIDELVAAARYLKYKYDIKVLAIDCFQQINYKEKLWYRDYELGLVLQRLKQLAKELDVAILLTSQLSRGAERRGAMGLPMMADLKGTSSLEEVADQVLLLYRYAYYGITEYHKGKPTGEDSKVIIAKNKDGQIGDVTLGFDREHVRFVPIEQEAPFVFEFPENRLADLE